MPSVCLGTRPPGAQRTPCRQVLRECCARDQIRGECFVSALSVLTAQCTPWCIHYRAHVCLTLVSLPHWLYTYYTKKMDITVILLVAGLIAVPLSASAPSLATNLLPRFVFIRICGATHFPSANTTLEPQPPKVSTHICMRYFVYIWIIYQRRCTVVTLAFFVVGLTKSCEIAATRPSHRRQHTTTSTAVVFRSQV
jgi:hypothetical protein